jgi:hypothetical protein
LADHPAPHRERYPAGRSDPDFALSPGAACTSWPSWAPNRPGDHHLGRGSRAAADRRPRSPTATSSSTGKVVAGDFERPRLAASAATSCAGAISPGTVPRDVLCRMSTPSPSDVPTCRTVVRPGCRRCVCRGDLGPGPAGVTAGFAWPWSGQLE